MWLKNKRERGVTLLEAMLFLTIAAVLLIMGLRQYQQYKLSADSELIKVNADKIFQAASYYYQMNCRPNRPAPAVDNNTLDPVVSTTPVVIDIQTDLVDKGLMSTDFPINPLIEQNAAGTWNGYTVQFLRKDEIRYVCTEGSDNPYSPDCTDREQIGTIVNWQIQVSARVRNQSLSGQLLNLSDATCLTSEESGGGVKGCIDSAQFAQICQNAEAIMNANVVGSPQYNAAFQDYTDNSCTGIYDNFVSFQRSPSFSTAIEGQSGLWILNKTVKQFTQMYETLPVADLISSSHNPEIQYFTCNN